ncbi:4-alpha-glucanotransferase/malto-oligosyltrehalose synthase,TIGR02401 [Pedobacter suwonensis]|uniref:4-alpha-glucanotransferase n=1 Tax=Pedobacter suwonensis TaxID=332999 RepID=A0A1I0TL95_9SPHI|nr:malto-oligosyltrehalose synthase [Pedobacter suwonensis]SFA52549.1 4-alpha-glucanotransferase/malto-oligosyltrehalose synthase,TIGR02401 [Pedobacter suwonensis]
MHKPTSTYRIQFHKNFNLKSLDQIIPYLTALGVGTLYASPIFEAMPGSTHGYDVVNPLKINPEIGTEAELIRISKKLKAAGISWLQDIVPNHMAYHPDNAWLMDVLQKGKDSDFASFFDIDLQKGDGRLMVPFLGEDIEEAIATQKLKLMAIKDKYYLNYGESNWPVNAETAKTLSTQVLRKINNDAEALTKIVQNQHYRLCNWQETNDKINYRRFFTVNALICLNMQRQEAFDLYHRYIFELIGKGIFQGLRIDHIDGLYNPEEYVQRLRKAVGKDIYIVVEKILEHGEVLPQTWKVQGTTGYDFLATVNNLLTNKAAEKPFNKLYQEVTGKKLDPAKLIYEKKSNILFKHMQGELDNLFESFLALELGDFSTIKNADLKRALAEMLIAMPVYRYYNYRFPLAQAEAHCVQNLLKPILEHKKLAKAGEFLHQVFLEIPGKKNTAYNQKLSHFFQRCMQFTGPLMAKGVEDTAMFTYNRFIGHAEVGDAPDAFGMTVNEFHDEMHKRQQEWPFAMNGSSTHDTKKGEDVRARLNVLTDLHGEWTLLVQQLKKTFAALKKEHAAFEQLHDNDIYLVLQTIIGALPFHEDDDPDIENRLAEFIVKALRESKKRSDWANPDENYEDKLTEFSQLILTEPQESNGSIRNFIKRIADFAVVNSLVQLTLKFTCPGIPDVYQGTELWDLSLVDPDNRRPVDYETRASVLAEFDHPVNFKNLLKERFSGKIKMWLTKTLLEIRKAEADVFEHGAYIPLEVQGKYSQHICAFARQYKAQWLITVVPLGFAKCCSDQNVAADSFDWEDTAVLLPNGAPLGWQNLITGKKEYKDPLHQGIQVSQLFNQVQLALIKLIPENNQRAAGVLMHISALPSRFGIGDLGPGAHQFVDFLAASRQRYWQVLPLNPTKKETGYSPYSSSSSMAGNTMLISPESLVEQALLSESDLNDYVLPETGKIDFEKTEKIKQQVLDRAYQRFKTKGDEDLVNEFDLFCKTEQSWLVDFAVYTCIKQHFKGKEWFNWSEKYKLKDPKTIADFEKSNQDEIEEIKWKQFIFYRQWYCLKEYANAKGVSLIGDLPFYLDYDSVEVWAQRENFLLDKNGSMTVVAGVPPDYFNEKGQLWGMPIYNWEKMKAEDFTWWENRLRKNQQLFNLLRLDHFRAFSTYWEVVAGSEDAVDGVWKTGVGDSFFKTIERKLGKLSFIAEDLGEISEDVEHLRKQFQLPGMKVLQFAFGEDIAGSVHIPHRFGSENYIAYTGTHDNNTTLGWFKNETDTDLKQRLSRYVGTAVNENNVNAILIRLCYASIAKMAIIPMQDILQLDETARMNIPGKASGNWAWRADNNFITEETINWLKAETEFYGR